MKVVPKSKKQLFLDYVHAVETGHWDTRSVFEAYCDCLPENVDVTGCERSLRFFHTSALTLNQAQIVMSRAVPGGYNAYDTNEAFSAIKEVFGDDAKIHVAREGSVCLYVKPSKSVQFNRRSKLELLNADEVSFDSDLQMFRLWWD